MTPALMMKASANTLRARVSDTSIRSPPTYGAMNPPTRAQPLAEPMPVVRSVVG
jgi:hypothetical protein